jgi:hypothetical protein
MKKTFTYRSNTGSFVYSLLARSEEEARSFAGHAAGRTSSYSLTLSQGRRHVGTWLRGSGWIA